MTYDDIVISGISVNPDRLGGIPCIKGTRIPASTVSDFAKAGHTVDQIIAEYPDITPRQIADALCWQAQPLAVRKARIIAAEPDARIAEAEQP